MRIELYIDGAWRAGAGERFSSHDPATGDKVWEGRAATPDDVSEAMAAARLAFPAWSRRPTEERAAIARKFGEIIKRRGEEIAQTISREMGKALWDARGEVQAMVGKVELSIRAQAERAGAKEEKRREDRFRRHRARASRARRARRVRAVQLPGPPAQRPHRACFARRQHHPLQAQRTHPRRRRAYGGSVG
jgi:succinylglutamic semialdehyde dehydrogenase